LTLGDKALILAAFFALLVVGAGVVPVSFLVGIGLSRREISPLCVRTDNLKRAEQVFVQQKKLLKLFIKIQHFKMCIQINLIPVAHLEGW
jgi:hypothetical protein